MGRNLPLPSALFAPSENQISQDKGGDTRSRKGHGRGDEEIKEEYHHDVFLHGEK